MASRNTPGKTPEKPRVIIAGAGIGGLTLAILLERANISYQVLERALEVKTLGKEAYSSIISSIGSAISLGSTISPLFKQLGIYDEFIAKGKRNLFIDCYNENRERSFIMDFEPVTEMGGYPGYIIPRSALYDILLRQVPPEKISMGKRVLSLTQNESEVMIRCSDGSTVHGDILVGADGAYSAVRQSLYARLKKEGKLPSSDSEALPYSCVCLVAQTSPLDPVKFPELKDEMCLFKNVLAEDRPYSWATLTTKDNVICWGVTQYLDKESSKENDSFRNSEWGAEATDAMCNEVRDFPIPGGDGTLTLGDLIDNTPKDKISKVMLEEKVFSTWYHGRTVLMGDACHKVHPAGGRGAISAIHDAICLANWINALPSTSVDDTEKIFKQYRAERLPPAEAAYTFGRNMANVSARTLKAKLSRYMVKSMPTWLWHKILVQHAANRPQVSFLPLITDTGTVKPEYQPSLHKTLQIMRDKEANQAGASDMATTMHTVPV
ncbi:hypothetical protein BGX28_010200 [Mortierella sp. GBA30]|nr:hypothetical protein BGX28_010200 [Mortierella sp. GBA30]